MTDFSVQFKIFLFLLLVITGGVPGQETGVEIEIPSQITIDSTSADTVFITEAGDTLAPLPPIEKMPEVTKFVKADYPPDAQKKGIVGSVLLEFVISDSGRVDSAKVIKGVEPSLDSAAVKAILKFEFTPAIAGGQAIPVLFQYEYHFTLSDAVAGIGEYVNFKGTLREKGTRTPIKDAMVVVSFPDTLTHSNLPVPFPVYLERISSFEGQYLEDSQMVTLTDSLGRFSFKSLPAGTVGVAFPISGYIPYKTRQLITKGKQTEVEFRLLRENYDEYEIVVYGKAEKKEVAKKSLSLKEIKRIPGFGGDAVKVVQALPGVARPPFISGLLVVRGSGVQDTRFFLDGIEIYKIFHFGGLKSTYNSDLLSAVDLYPGGFNVRYGGAVGGIVELIGRPGKTDRWHGYLDANFPLDAAFLAEGPLNDKWALSLSARRSYADYFLRPLFEEFPLPISIIPIYYDAVARLDYKMTKRDKFFLTFFAVGDDLEIFVGPARGGSEEVSDARDRAEQEDDFQKIILGYDKTFSRQLSNSLRFSLGNQDITASNFGFSAWDAKVYSLYVRNETSYAYTPELTFKLGLDADIDSSRYDLSILSIQTGPQQTSTGQIYSNLGTYAQLEYKPLKEMLLIPGVRYDRFMELDDGAVSARLTGRYEFMRGHTPKFAVGTYSQTPKPFGQAIDSSWGNPTLPPTLAEHYVAGYELDLTDLISLDVQGFYNRQTQIPRQTDSIDTKTGRPVNFVPDTDGRMYGMEIMLRHNPGPRFFGWVAYTFSRSERRAPGPLTDFFGGQGYDSSVDPEKWILFERDQAHILQLIGTWRLPRNWESGFRFRFVTGNPSTPRLGYTQQRFEFNADFGQYETIYGEARSDRVGPFVQLDLRVDKKFVFNSWLLDFYLDIQNVNYFIYNSPEFYVYNYDDSERDVVGGIILPTFGIKASF